MSGLLVKPLVWNGGSMASALDGAISYTLFSENVHAWFVTVYLAGHERVTLGPFRREAKAKAAAEEDYRQRVLSSVDMQPFNNMVDRLKDLEADLPRIQRALLAVSARDKTVRRNIRALRNHVQRSPVLLETDIDLKLNQLLSLMKIQL